jgi:hypothetical protein
MSNMKTLWSIKPMKINLLIMNKLTLKTNTKITNLKSTTKKLFIIMRNSIMTKKLSIKSIMPNKMLTILLLKSKEKKNSD